MVLVGTNHAGDHQLDSFLFQDASLTQRTLIKFGPAKLAGATPIAPEGGLVHQRRGLYHGAVGVHVLPALHTMEKILPGWRV